MHHPVPILTALLLGPAAAGDVIHVDDDAPPGGDGSTWSTAYRFLQDALEAAAGADEILVARGTYTTDRTEAHPGGSGDRTISFVLDGSAALRGGYAGLGAPDPDERDIALFETVLDGDLAGNDGPGFANRADNAYHVVLVNPGAAPLLEGFLVRGGNAYGNGPHLHGAGLYTDGGSPEIVRCVFRSNRAGSHGGAVYALGGALRIDGCAFSSNVANIAALWFNEEPDVEMIDCAVLDNEGLAGPGGVVNYDGTLRISGSEISGNVATSGPGGLVSGFGSTIMANSVVRRNLGDFLAGGALFAADDVVINCIFSENTSPMGGAVYCSGPLAVDSCTFAGNEPNSMMMDYLATPYVMNSILWGTTAPRITNDPAFDWTPPPVNYSNISGGWSGPGGHNIDADPLFVQAGTGNVRLAQGSPCVDAGSTADLPADVLDLDGDGNTFESLPVDLDGNPRVQAAAVDMGAFEGQFEPMPDSDQAGGLDPGEYVILVPGGGPFNPTLSAAAIVTNVSGPEDAVVTVTQLASDLHPDAAGYARLTVLLDCETSMPSGQFLANLFIPFDAGDLAGAEPHQANLTRYDPETGNWALAVAHNTGSSAGFAGPIGDRVVSIGGAWGNTLDLGDYGIFWDPAAQAGFAWANVDHAGEFTVGGALCPADCLQTPDGVVSIVDVLALLGSWGAAAGGGPCDINYDGVVGESDFLAQLDAWGPCPEPLPALPPAGLDPIRGHWGSVERGCPADLDGDGTVGPRDLLTAYARWGES